MFAGREVDHTIGALNFKLDPVMKHLGIQETPADRFAAPAGVGLTEIDELLMQGTKIQAIKRYRELTAAGLKEAKDAVERRSRY